MGFLPNYYWKL
ncbi:hypothetical protein NP493_1079g00029 [Ridgeia piscesae]|nr:hypothetical protein NP493_1079g00029 [Ridgeia piscesae]